MNKGEMDRTCGMCRGEEKFIQAFGGKTEGKDHLEVLGVGRRMIL
jgi:hypothetical protein